MKVKPSWIEYHYKRDRKLSCPFCHMRTQQDEFLWISTRAFTRHWLYQCCYLELFFQNFEKLMFIVYKPSSLVFCYDSWNDKRNIVFNCFFFSFKCIISASSKLFFPRWFSFVLITNSFQIFVTYVWQFLAVCLYLRIEL